MSAGKLYKYYDTASASLKTVLSAEMHKAIEKALEVASREQLSAETVVEKSEERNRLLDAIEGMRRPGKSSYEVQLEVELAAKPLLAARRRMRKEARDK
jgi:hypothetical protein